MQGAQRPPPNSKEDRPAFPNPGTPPCPRTPPTTRAVVMHAAPLQYKPGTMQRWIEENNKGVTIVGIRWLLKEDRGGQEASSLVIYIRDLVEVKSLRMAEGSWERRGYLPARITRFLRWEVGCDVRVPSARVLLCVEWLFFHLHLLYFL